MVAIRQKAALSVIIMSLLFSIAFAAEDRPPAGEIKTGSITGTIMISGVGPLTGGQVMVYDAAVGPPPMPFKYERTPDIAKDVDTDGKFRVELPPGKYYISAIKRLSGERIGPPQTGDYVFRSLDEKGAPREYLIQTGSLIDIGTVSAAPLKPERLLSHAVTTSIEGVVKGENNRPVADAVVAAFVTPAMQGKPLFVSTKTGKDGKYVLQVPPGTYYIRARNVFASGPPKEGQIVGYYGEGGAAPVTVKEGERKIGTNINVVLFPGSGPFSEANPQKSQQKSPKK